MFNFIYENIYPGDTNNSDIIRSKDNPDSSLILSPSPRSNNRGRDIPKNKGDNTILLLLNKEILQAKHNIELQQQLSSKNKLKLQQIIKAINSVFIQSTSMVKQIDKLDLIDGKNHKSLQLIYTNLNELNNIFNDIYGHIKQRK